MLLVRFVLVSALLAGCVEVPVEVALDDVVVRVDPAGAHLNIRRGDGSVLLDGRAPAFRHADATWTELYGSYQVDETAPDWQEVRSFSHVIAGPDGVRFQLAGGGEGAVVRTAEGTLQISFTRADANRARVGFACSDDEKFLGFGAMPMDVEHRGATIPIWVSEQGVGRVPTDEQPGDWFLRGTRHQSYFPVPFFLSSRRYGVRGDTAARSVYSMCTPDEAWHLEAWESTVSFHLFVGATPLEVLARHAELDGKPPVPPPFVFAPWNDAVRGAANVRAVAQKLRQNHVPSSAIWTEDWAGGEASGDQYHLTYDWTVDRALYPDAEALADELHGAGFKWLGYFNTFAPTDGDHFRPEYLIHHDDGTPYLFDSVQFGKQSSLVDLANPAAADWMAQAMRAALAIGFDGWMADYGEWMPVDLAGEAAHQQYPVAWQKLNERVLGDDQIAFVRSGFTGSQAIAHQVVWAGDQSTDFDVGDGLPSVLPIELGLGVAGLPFVGSDVAGYMTTGGHPAATKELFFRWSVLGALSPLMRTHHGAAPDQNWRFDSDDETLAHWKRWATVHTQLHPLLLAAATEASRTGAPLVRHLALGFPDDAVAWGVADEYLLGPSLLVAPVLQMGQTARPVYLPAGHWVRLFGPPLVVEGPTQVMVDAPLGELPVFAPAGALLVLLPPTVETLTGALPETREVIAVLGADGRFDEGTRSWTLTSSRAPSSGAAVTFNGAMVGAIGAGRALDVTISGNGTLAIADGSATLVVGGAADQTVHLIW